MGSREFSLESSGKQTQGQKYGTLHEFACHPCAGAMLIFFVVPILLYVLPKQAQFSLLLSPTFLPINLELNSGFAKGLFQLYQDWLDLRINLMNFMPEVSHLPQPDPSSEL